MITNIYSLLIFDINSPKINTTYSPFKHTIACIHKCSSIKTSLIDKKIVTVHRDNSSKKTGSIRRIYPFYVIPAKVYGFRPSQE
jgi:hypothetical protein